MVRKYLEMKSGKGITEKKTGIIGNWKAKEQNGWKIERYDDNKTSGQEILGDEKWGKIIT